MRASARLDAAVSSLRCRDGRCLVVHAAIDSIAIVAAVDLSPADPIVLERGAEPRDVALVDDHTAVISQFGRADLLVVDLRTRAVDHIDLSAFADADGLPEAQRMATCERRVFVQLRRLDRETGTPAPGSALLAVIDLERSGADRVVDVDPNTPGVQGIALARRPDFDMPVDCAAARLYIAEPIPLMQGGGGYEQVDLSTYVASEYPVATGAEVGGFEVVRPDLYWLITHTEFGPGPSSHLGLVGGPPFETHNTFANEHVNDLAFDRAANLLFYPDPCATLPPNASCQPGVHVFDATSGARLTVPPIALEFPPIELAISR